MTGFLEKCFSPFVKFVTQPGELKNTQIVLCLLGSCFVAGLFIIILFAFQSSSIPQGLSVVGAGWILAGGIFMAGALLGFLFGIPRTLQEGSQSGGRYQDNTNLEQISDWLCKIIVGVGLTQLIFIPSTLQKYAAEIAPALGSFPSSEAFAIAIFIFFSIDGFLVGYLWTRVYFGSELESSHQKLETQVTHLNVMQEQNKNDKTARLLVAQILNPPPGLPDVKLEDLKNAISKASKEMKTEIFYTAQKIRRDNWRNLMDKPSMERTIPIFQAMVADDKRSRYHTIHGQLGFALKDQLKPNWKEAEAELTKAIEIRGSWKENGGLMYEFNRAICIIENDKEGGKVRKATPDVREKIVNDLKAAATDSEIHTIIPTISSISEWLNLNNLKMIDSPPYIVDK